MRHRLPAPDFLRPVARPGVLAWAWCATGLLVLAAAGLDAHAAWQTRAQALADASAAQASAAQASTNPRRPATRPAVAAQAGSSPTPEARRQAEAAAWLQRLAHPWPLVWAGIDSASERAAGGLAGAGGAAGGAAGRAAGRAAAVAVGTAGGMAWLNLSHGEGGTLRLVGLTGNLAAAEAAAQALRTQQHQGAPLWRDVALVAIERVPDGQRVEIVAQLALPGPPALLGPPVPSAEVPQ